MEQLNEKMWDLKKVTDRILKEIRPIREMFFEKYSELSVRVLSSVVATGMKTHLALKTFDSELLGRYSRDVAKADEIKPITVELGIFSQSHYIPSKSIIRVNILGNLTALAFLSSKFRYIEGFDISQVSKPSYAVNVLGLPKEQAERFSFEFTEQAFLGSFQHEFTHYLDDTIHNPILPKMIKMDKKDKDYLRLPQYVYRYLGEAEINSLMGNIKFAKKHFPKKKWDSFTFEDVCHAVPSLAKLYGDFSKYPELLAIWKKKVLTRMNREGLLGANMGKVGVYESSGIQGILDIGSFKSL